MTADLLRRCGEALYGPRWINDLARALQVSDRTMRRWANGSYDMPGGACSDLLVLCCGRRTELEDLVALLADDSARRYLAAAPAGEHVKSGD